MGWGPSANSCGHRENYSSGNAYGRRMTDRGLRAEVELAFDLTPEDEFAYNGSRNC